MRGKKEKKIGKALDRGAEEGWGPGGSYDEITEHYDKVEERCNRAGPGDVKNAAKGGADKGSILKGLDVRPTIKTSTEMMTQAGVRER